MRIYSKYCENIILLAAFILTIYDSAIANDWLKNVNNMLLLNRPVLSPDREKVAFDFQWNSKNKSGSDICILSLKSNEIKLVSRNAGGDINESPAWSEDSKHIIFRSVSKSGVRILSVDIANMSKETMVYFHYDNNQKNNKYIEIPYLYPIWSPLTDNIVYIKERFQMNDIYDQNTVQYEGYVYNIKERKEIEIAEALSASVISGHTWSISSDGRFVLYAKEKNGYNNIWFIDIQNISHDEHQLTKKYKVTYLLPSPVENEILFVAHEGNKSTWSLHRFNLETRRDDRLYESNYNNLGYPSWSQDGRLIVFIDNRNLIKIIDVTKRIITTELEIKRGAITYPLLIRNNKIIFYTKHSSIWSIDITGHNLKKIFPSGKN